MRWRLTFYPSRPTWVSYTRTDIGDVSDFYPFMDDDRYLCKGCGKTYPDDSARDMPVVMGDSGLPIHLGICWSCEHAEVGAALDEIYVEVLKQERWSAFEDRIDASIKLNFPEKARGSRPALHKCSPPEAKKEQGWEMWWDCPECKLRWRKPPWYTAYQPVPDK